MNSIAGIFFSLKILSFKQNLLFTGHQYNGEYNITKFVGGMKK